MPENKEILKKKKKMMGTCQKITGASQKMFPKTNSGQFEHQYEL